MSAVLSESSLKATTLWVISLETLEHSWCRVSGIRGVGNTPERSVRSDGSSGCVRFCQELLVPFRGVRAPPRVCGLGLSGLSGRPVVQQPPDSARDG